MFQFFGKGEEKIQTEEEKARCAQKCADATLSVLEIFTTRAKQKLMGMVENYITTYMDYVYDISKYVNTVIRLVSNWRTTLFDLASQSSYRLADEVIKLVGYDRLPHEVQTNIVRLVKLYQKFMGECNCAKAFIGQGFGTGASISAVTAAIGSAGSSLVSGIVGAVSGVVGAVSGAVGAISGALGGSSEVGVAGTDVVNKPMIAKVQVETTFNKNSVGVGKTLYNASVQFSGGVKQAREYVTLAAESLTNTDLYTARKVADYIRTLHPSLIPFAEGYPMMATLSEYTASWIYCNEPDKSTLSLIGWGEKSRAKAVRRCLEGKIRPDRVSMISTSYDTTNKMFYDCLSKEFKNTSNPNMVVTIDDILNLGLSHGLHVAGDVLFRQNHMSNGTLGRMGAIKKVVDVLGPSEILLNYKYPIIEDVTVDNSPVLEDVDGGMMKVDKRKNPYVDGFTVLDDGGLR